MECVVGVGPAVGSSNSNADFVSTTTGSGRFVLIIFTDNLSFIFYFLSGCEITASIKP